MSVREDHLRPYNISQIIALQPWAHLTWVEKLLCRPHTISDRFIAKLAGLHVGSHWLGILAWNCSAQLISWLGGESDALDRGGVLFAWVFVVEGQPNDDNADSIYLRARLARISFSARIDSGFYA